MNRRACPTWTPPKKSRRAFSLPLNRGFQGVWKGETHGSRVFRNVLAQFFRSRFRGRKIARDEPRDALPKTALCRSGEALLDSADIGASILAAPATLAGTGKMNRHDADHSSPLSTWKSGPSAFARAIWIEIARARAKAPRRRTSAASHASSSSSSSADSAPASMRAAHKAAASLIRALLSRSAI